MKYPRFKPRFGWIRDGLVYWHRGYNITQRVTVRDARDITPEKAVEKVLQAYWDAHKPYIVLGMFKEIAKAAGMTATVKNGRVRVRRAKR